MQVAHKITALFDALTLADVEAMPPAHRRRFADICRHWSRRAEMHTTHAGTGVLGELHTWRRDD
jgi:hypothetical protein